MFVLLIFRSPLNWAFGCAVITHMHACPPARSGVATRTGRMTGRGITRPAQALAFKARKVGDTRSGGEALPLRGAWGGAPRVFLRKGSLPAWAETRIPAAR